MTPDLLLTQARSAVAQGKLQEAERVLAALLEIAPDHPAGQQGMALVAERRGDDEAALHWHSRLEASRPGEAEAAYNVAVTLMRLGHVEMAEGKLRRAIALNPKFAPASNNLGNLLLQRECYADAEACYRRAIAAAPALIDARYNLGLALQKQGRTEEAAKALRDTLRYDRGHAPAWLALGTLHHEAFSYNEAVQCYQHALTAKPGFADAYFNLGKALQDIGRNADALTAYRHVLSPNSVSVSQQVSSCAYFNLGRLLSKMGHFDEWIRHFEACPEEFRTDPNYTLFGLDVARQSCNATQIGIHLAALLETVDRMDDDGQVSHALALLQYLDVTQEALHRCYLRFNELAMQRTGGLRLASWRPGEREGRLRIGYLSPDFNKHVMGLLMYDVIAHHDHSRFEVFLYYLDDQEDTYTARFRAACAKFTSLKGLESSAAARQIASDRLDLLVDLGGHTADSRPLILAYRPAPIQITHLGYHGSVGLDTVDYKITDRYADLEENGTHLVERLLPMAGCLMPFRRQPPAEVGLGRAELGIRSDQVVFGAFVGANKLSPRCLATWRKILEQVENGVLAFSPHSSWVHAGIERCLTAAGIPSERIVFLPVGTFPDLGRWRYRLVDIVLDTFPYTGGDTTVAALDMAVPVVTLVGERQSERVTFSILRNLGVQGGIAQTEAEYIDIACRLAGSAVARAAMAGEIRQCLESRPIADIAAYTCNLETAYLTALSPASMCRE